jgi:hypothetical protein
LFSALQEGQNNKFEISVADVPSLLARNCALEHFLGREKNVQA